MGSIQIIFISFQRGRDIYDSDSDRVISVMGFLPANVQLVTPFHSDGQTDDHQRLMPYGAGYNKEDEKSAQSDANTARWL